MFQSLLVQPNIIGHDWKDFDLGTFTWEVFDDLVYFIETPDNDIWQLQFIDFEGSSTGVSNSSGRECRYDEFAYIYFC